MIGNKITIPLSNGRVISYEIYDSISLLLNSNCAYVDVIKDNNGIIIEVNFDNLYYLKIGDKIEVPYNNKLKTYYICNFISESDKKTNFFIKEFKETKSTTFITPILGKTNDYYSVYSYFINTYRHYDKIKNEDFIYLMYRHSDNSEYSELHSNLLNHTLFVNKIKLNDSRFEVFQFTIPEEYKDDVKLIMKGKYHWTSKLYRQRVLAFRQEGRSQLIGKILYDDKNLRKHLSDNVYHCYIGKDVALYDAPILSNEILKQ